MLLHRGGWVNVELCNIIGDRFQHRRLGVATSPTVALSTSCSICSIVVGHVSLVIALLAQACNTCASPITTRSIVVGGGSIAD